MLRTSSSYLRVGICLRNPRCSTVSHSRHIPSPPHLHSVSAAPSHRSFFHSQHPSSSSSGWWQSLFGSSSGTQSSTVPRNTRRAPHPSPLPASISGLSPSDLDSPWVDRALGALYGQALGDAFGLATEFCSKEEVLSVHGKQFEPSTGEGAIDFPNSKIPTQHAALWIPGDWTDDTDQMLLILETLQECYGNSNDGTPPLTEPTDSQLTRTFAEKLHHWVYNGFPELGDTQSLGLGVQTYKVVHHPQFLSDPIEAAYEVWEKGNYTNAANGGVMRTSVTGVFDSHEEGLQRVRKHTQLFCASTHADPRCIVSCQLVALIIARLVQGACPPGSRFEELESLIRWAADEAQSEASLLAKDVSNFREHVQAPTDLSQLHLAEPGRIGFTFKTMAAGLWGLRYAASANAALSTEAQDSIDDRVFEDALQFVVREGGDADTNGAVVGALVGARIGFRRLPREWIDRLPAKRWLDSKASALIRLMQERRDRQPTITEEKQ